MKKIASASNTRDSIVTRNAMLRERESIVTQTHTHTQMLCVLSVIRTFLILLFSISAVGVESATYPCAFYAMHIEYCTSRRFSRDTIRTRRHAPSSASVDSLPTCRRIRMCRKMCRAMPSSTTPNHKTHQKWCTIWCTHGDAAAAVCFQSTCPCHFLSNNGAFPFLLLFAGVVVFFFLYRREYFCDTFRRHTRQRQRQESP